MAKIMDDDFQIGVEVKADTKQASLELQQFAQKARKIVSLSNQGEYQQGGTLSVKQADMYKNVLKEMESIQKSQQRRLMGAEQRYTQELHREQQKRLQKLQQLENQYRKDESNYNRVNGNLLGKNLSQEGGYANKNIIDYHLAKLNTSRQTYEQYQSTMGTQELPNSIKMLSSNVDDLKKIIKSMEVNQEVAGRYTEGIEGMSLSGNNSGGLSKNISSQLLAGMVSMNSIGQWLGFIRNGIQSLRQSEASAFNVTQKLGYNTTRNADSGLRDDSAKTGILNGYDIDSTLSLQNMLIRGGTRNLSNLQSDTFATQQFSRAYATDTQGLADIGVFMQKMGSMEEGSMQRLANLIAGAIGQSGMGGREEEMMSATMSLISSMSRNQLALSEQQLGEVVGLQSQISSIPGLTGSRGAEMLSGLGQALSGGTLSSGMKVLLRGTDTNLMGVEGELELRRRAEQGLTNQNLQAIFGNSNSMFADGNANSILQMWFQQNGISISAYDKLLESGVLSNWAEGNFTDTSKLSELGLESIQEEINNANNSATMGVNNIESKDKNFKQRYSKGADELSKTWKNVFHSLPFPVQAGGYTAMGLAGGLLMPRAIGKVSSMFGNAMGSMGGGTVGSYISGGLGGKLQNLLKGTGASDGLLSQLSHPIQASKDLLGKSSSKVTETVTQATTKLSDEIASATSTSLVNITDDAVASISRASGGMANNLGSIVKNTSAMIPLVGSTLELGLDRALNPETSPIRSFFKATGGLLGGIGGAAAGATATAATFGLGSATVPVFTAGGGAVGSKGGDLMYTALFGDQDQGGSERGAIPTMKDWFSGNKTKLQVDKLEIKDKADTGFSGGGRSKGATLDNNNGEYTIRVVLEGDISGMSKDNENKIVDALTTNLFSYNSMDPYNMTRQYTPGIGSR